MEVRVILNRVLWCKSVGLAGHLSRDIRRLFHTIYKIHTIVLLNSQIIMRPFNINGLR